jgi:hypothetical protein
MRKWSPGTLYREACSSPTEILYEYPSRLEATLLMLIIMVELGVTALFCTMAGDPFPTMVGGLFAGGLALLVLPRIWDQRVLRIRLVDRELQYLRRTPFQETQETVPFSELKAVLVEVTNPRACETDQDFDLALLTGSGHRIHLGNHTRHGTAALGRRLSRYLRIPLRMSVS